ncbi:hypothetical protein HPB52_003833 [Rhipicephalus sanguineus]|uniref:Nuclease HARBI1 n=1 Tax=Rhipicephalus sanguineus TaxID=34632 RepID=A0A9D4QHU4_RHISA|nr:hypothetical protein HPB52_003833 [Rhipicephalus sanguineus]
MAASRMDVARRLSAFEFACHAMGVDISEVLCLPKIRRPALRDRGNPMELYDEEHFHARYRFTKNAVRQLLAMLPLQESGDNRGQHVPPMLQLLMALRFYGAGTFQTVTGDLVRILQSTVCRAVGKVTLRKARCSFLTKQDRLGRRPTWAFSSPLLASGRLAQVKSKARGK